MAQEVENVLLRQRPHQGIGGLCPADRFFEIETKLRHVIERGIAENVLERALRRAKGSQRQFLRRKVIEALGALGIENDPVLLPLQKRFVEKVIDEVFDLLVSLEADDHTLDFPVLYASGRDGWVSEEAGSI